MTVAEQVAELVERSKSGASSDDTLIHIAWLIDGLDLWHRSGGNAGHTLDETKGYVLSQILHAGGLHGETQRADDWNCGFNAAVIAEDRYRKDPTRPFSRDNPFKPHGDQ